MSLEKNLLLKHVVEDEKKAILRNLIDKIEIVTNKHINESTDFLDPYEVYLSKSILNRFDDVKYSIDGGYEGAERSIIYIYPDYVYDFKGDYIKRLSFKINEFITHKNVLGSLMSLGIERKKIGDIVFSNNYCHIFLKSDISNYVEFNLSKIGKYNIHLEDNVDFILPTIEYKDYKLIISSLRLDVFLSAVLNISRSKASNLITNEKVKVNFKDENKTSLKLNPGDLISVRKFGRIIFENVEQLTKKDKYVINVKIPK
ncbi:RNA-binding protein [Anaerosphaera multitolerans]|uniref:RNA-binding protein n=1 Tax=Anaerosphaera multitolerans TaxID=2487351 RepID=A0A437S7V7_9FIRM|nr:YlmH/Sll1252 family protein [Anaerosphaera multitolerans]RVU55169.1 RNA-binding protein [Anaerosphaera multitolerans]